jgi:dTDP-L-rhamnose 4-epimerase
MVGSFCIVTGGAGFIGCALSPGLAKRFDRVLVLDKLHPQVHSQPVRPRALDAAVEFRRADILQPEVWDKLLASPPYPETIVHLAAETGTGQSLTEASRHARENVLGTTTMLDALSRHGHMPDHFVLASSRAVYGEGAWMGANKSAFYPGQRSREQLAAQDWDFPEARPLPSSVSSTQPRPTSVYGATKLAQEHILEAWVQAFGSKLSIMRLQNVYGPGQSLINSYTGIVSLFARLAREGASIPLYEDGLMLRDFVFIDDVAAAILAAIDLPPTGTRRLDIGTGTPSTIRDVAHFIAERYGAPPPHVSKQYRYGDVRHAACDIMETGLQLNWSPHWSMQLGIESLCAWIDLELAPSGPTATQSK